MSTCIVIAILFSLLLILFSPNTAMMSISTAAVIVLLLEGPLLVLHLLLFCILILCSVWLFLLSDVFFVFIVLCYCVCVIFSSTSVSTIQTEELVSKCSVSVVFSKYRKFQEGFTFNPSKFSYNGTHLLSHCSGCAIELYIF